MGAKEKDKLSYIAENMSGMHSQQMTIEEPSFISNPSAITYPKFRYMGSKHKLLPWIREVTEKLEFTTVLDAFAGSGAVSYLFKTMGKTVSSNDFLNFSKVITSGLCVNSKHQLDEEDIKKITGDVYRGPTFIQDTWKGIFYTPNDLAFLDSAYYKITHDLCLERKDLALTALIRSCIKKQPRGIFTVSGDLSNYDDGRRDLRLTLKEHFIEQCLICNDLVFDNGFEHTSAVGPIENFSPTNALDLVYMDPPYVPRSDDNCYTKRYHFLEGLSKYWEGEDLMLDTKVKKIQKKYTPFSYRSSAKEAFRQLFHQFSDSLIVLSYSSNGYPDLPDLVKLMKEVKRNVVVHEKDHRYHIGNHSATKRNKVVEYLIVGT